jgi:hypothetical protein
MTPCSLVDGQWRFGSTCYLSVESRAATRMWWKCRCVQRMEAADFSSLLKIAYETTRCRDARTESETQRKCYSRTTSFLQALMYCEVLFHFYSSRSKLLRNSFLYAQSEPRLDQVTLYHRWWTRWAEAVTVVSRSYRMSCSNSGTDTDCSDWNFL